LTTIIDFEAYIMLFVAGLVGSASEGGSGPESEPESIITGASGTRSDIGSGTEGSTEGAEGGSSEEGGSSPYSVSSQDIFVHQSVISMPGFRSLAEEEEVEVDYKITDKGNCRENRKVFSKRFWIEKES
jgi:cold shock CspA family protein